MADEATRRAVSQIPLLKTHAGPRERALWPQRLKEEYQALIRFVEQNKAADNDWFRLESNPDGTRWTGTCWFVHELLRYEFRVEAVTWTGFRFWNCQQKQHFRFCCENVIAQKIKFWFRVSVWFSYYPPGHAASSRTGTTL
uniref:Ubiquitin-fold modifier-conjugating enzyme 1 n=1 Tax=Poecilia reticulata TaxID=8081 RepID=A0A3P9PTY3_POERE